MHYEDHQDSCFVAEGCLKLGYDKRYGHNLGITSIYFVHVYWVAVSDAFVIVSVTSHVSSIGGGFSHAGGTMYCPTTRMMIVMQPPIVPRTALCQSIHSWLTGLDTTHLEYSYAMQELSLTCVVDWHHFYHSSDERKTCAHDVDSKDGSIQTHQSYEYLWRHNLW